MYWNIYTYDKLGRVTQKQLPGLLNNHGEYFIVTENHTYTYAYNLDYMEENGYLYGTTVETSTCYDNMNSSPSYYNIVNEFYDAYGNLRNSISYNSGWVNTARYTYDDLLRVTSMVDAEGNVSTAAYDAWGRQHEMTDATGNLYINDYDVASRKTMSYFVAADQIAAYRANPSSNSYKEDYVEVYLDQFGRTVKRKVYEGWPIASDDLSELYQYDIAGNLTGYTDPKRNLNEDGCTTSYEYDELNRVIKVKDALNQVTGVAYTVLGKTASVTIRENEGSSGYITLYTKAYNELGNMTGKTDASDLTDRYSYNGVNLLAAGEDKGGGYLYQYYDDLNQLKEIIRYSETIPGFYDYQYSYRNPFGYFDEIKYEYGSPTAQAHYYYDQRGQIVQKNVFTGDIQSNLKLQYDNNGSLKSQGTGAYDSNYFYTNYGYTDGRLTSVQMNGLQAPGTSDADNAVYEYYADGKLKKITYPRLADDTLLTTEYMYNALGRLTSLTNRKGSVVLSAFTYTYDANGNIVTANDGSSTTTYTYDKLNRLIRIQPATGNSTAYTYDLRGNRQTQSGDRFELDLVSTDYTYNLDYRLEKATKGTVSLEDMLKSVTGPAISADTEAAADGIKETADEAGAGNTSEADDKTGTAAETETADGLNALPATVTGTAVTVSPGIEAITETIGETTTNMDYYADGLRADKYTSEGYTMYVYDLSDHLIAEARNSSLITANYVWGPDRVLMKKETGGSEYYYLYNGHGDVIQIVDKNGNVVNNYQYDEWGNILESNETISNPFKYAGAIYDQETGLYYLNARYYDPAIGRFLNEDSVEGQIDSPISMNLYIYCYNNPLIYSDFSGNTPKDFLMGMGDTIFAGTDNRIVRWALGKLGLTIKDYAYTDDVDYYAGRVMGDVLLMGGGMGSIIKGVSTIVGSIAGGGAITVGSGGTLVIGGVAICVGGVVVGSAEVVAGAAVLSIGAGNFNDDLKQLMTKHGEQRAQERKFSNDKINDIIQNYSHKIYQSGGKTVYAKKNGNFYDVVITNKAGDVITTVGGSSKTLKNWSDVARMLNNNGGYSSLPID